MNTKKKNIFVIISLLSATIVAYIFNGNSFIVNEVILPIRNAFMRLINLVMGVVIFFNIINSIIDIGSFKQTKKILIEATILFAITTAASTLIGIITTKNLYTLYSYLTINRIEIVCNTDINGTFLQMLLSIIPNDPFSPFINTNIMQILFLALIVACGLQKYAHNDLKSSFKAICNLVNNSLNLLSTLLPIIFFLILVPMMINNSVEILTVMFSVIGLYYICCIICVLLIYCPMIKIKSGISLKRFWKIAISTAITAFCSASSLITLPETQLAADNLGIPQNISRLVLPLGATINMDGTAIFLGMICVIISSVYGIYLSFASYLYIIFTVLLMSISTPGIPGASLAIMISVLQSVGLPLEGIALFSGVDMFIEMGGTTLNVIGDLVCSASIKETTNKIKEKG